MYARGITAPEIQGYLAEVYGTEVSREFISTVTDEVMAEGMAWPNWAAGTAVPGGSRFGTPRSATLCFGRKAKRPAGATTWLRHSAAPTGRSISSRPDRSGNSRGRARRFGLDLQTFKRARRINDPAHFHSQRKEWAHRVQPAPPSLGDGRFFSIQLHTAFEHGSVK